MNEKRIRILREGHYDKGPIIYWMQRDQRINDNWALVHAINEANNRNENVIVIFIIPNKFLDATLRQYYFIIEGLKEVEINLSKLNIPFFVTLGNPTTEIPKFVKKFNASLLVSDFNPLNIIKEWNEKIRAKINIAFHQVDTHNIVPIWEASDKLEFAAYTIRPKINKQLPEFLVEFPKIKKMNPSKIISPKINWEEIYNLLKVDKNVKPVSNFVPGNKAANKVLKNFIENKLHNYAEERNDPNKNVLSNISPYLHFGQISAQRIALILNIFQNDESVNSFLEELIIRRELADNFCYYNFNYDNFEGFPNWAKVSLGIHRDDKREYIYSVTDFESARTHDDLWNAAQTEMVEKGKMHGFMRMYWAKKLLEWTESPEQALAFGIYLNDKYELDGTDPNGYAGLAWSIGGVHDRAWSERSVYGKVRYMNYNGCKRKFDVKGYINSNLTDYLL